MCLGQAGLRWPREVLVLILGSVGSSEGLWVGFHEPGCWPGRGGACLLPLSWLFKRTSTSWNDSVWFLNWICFHCRERGGFLWEKEFAYLKKAIQWLMEWTNVIDPCVCQALCWALNIQLWKRRQDLNSQFLHCTGNFTLLEKKGSQRLSAWVSCFTDKKPDSVRSDLPK